MVWTGRLESAAPQTLVRCYFSAHAELPALESVGVATSGRTREEALSRINEVIHMIVQEFTQEGKALPEGPEDFVEIEEVSQEQPRIAITV